MDRGALQPTELLNNKAQPIPNAGQLLAATRGRWVVLYIPGVRDSTEKCNIITVSVARALCF